MALQSGYTNINELLTDPRITNALPVGIGQYNTYSTEGNLPFNQRQAIVRPGGVTEYNPLTKEEADLVNHPSVKWIREHDEQGRLLADLPNPWDKSYSSEPEGVKTPSLFDKAPSEEYRKHLKIVGELAKRNPEVKYASGLFSDLVNRFDPNEPRPSIQQLQEPLKYIIGQPEPQQPSFQAQQGAEQPGQVWQQGLQQAIQDGSIREYLDKTVYKRETEAERKKREEEEKKKQALTQMGDKTKGYTSTPYQMQFTPVNTLLR